MRRGVPEGRRLLREAFNKHWWPLKVPLSERVGALGEAVGLFESNHILLLGGGQAPGFVDQTRFD